MEFVTCVQLHGIIRAFRFMELYVLSDSENYVARFTGVEILSDNLAALRGYPERVVPRAPIVRVKVPGTGFSGRAESSGSLPVKELELTVGYDKGLFEPSDHGRDRVTVRFTMFRFGCSGVVYIQDLGRSFGGRGGRPNGLRPLGQGLAAYAVYFDYASC